MARHDSREVIAIRKPPASPVGERWAIVVGVSKYRHAGLDLLHADRDAREFNALIQSPQGGGFKPEHVVFLVNETATTENVTRALRTFLKKPARDDLVIIYFACHGSPDPERPGNVYLLTHDVDPADIAGTAVPMREIDLSLRENLHAEKVVIIADTCHSAAIGGGPGTRRAVNGAAAINAYLQALSETRGGVALLTSAEANEVSVDGTQWGGGHGVFTHFLLEGMRGAADVSPKNGVVTVGELFEYVRENVKRATNHRQHPAIGTTTFDRELPMAVPGLVAAAGAHAGAAAQNSATVAGDAERSGRSQPAPGAAAVGRMTRPSARSLLMAGTAVVAITVMGALWYGTRKPNESSTAVDVLDFLSVGNAPGEVGSLGPWLQQQLAGTLADSGWQAVSRSVLDAQRAERGLQTSGAVDPSTALPGQGVRPGRAVGGMYQMVASDTIALEAQVVDIASGRIVSSHVVRVPVVKLREGVRDLASGVIHNVAPATRDNSTPGSPPRRAVSHYVSGLLWLSRNQMSLAQRSFRDAVREDSTYVPAANALRIVSRFGVDTRPPIVVGSFHNAGTPGRRDSIPGFGALGPGVAALLVNSLVDGGARVLERAKLESLLQEQRLGTSTETSARAGKLLGARYSVAGSYLVLGPEWILDVQLDDLSSGLVRERFTVKGSYDRLSDSLYTLVEGLGARLAASVSVLPPIGSADALDSLQSFQTRIRVAPVRR